MDKIDGPTAGTHRFLYQPVISKRFPCAIDTPNDHLQEARYELAQPDVLTDAACCVL